MKHFSQLFFTFFLAACGADISSGSQGIGQQCFFPSDCSAGLSCYQRACVSIGGVAEPDAVPDMTPECVDGESICQDLDFLLTCVNGRFVTEPCEQFCLGGRCTTSLCEATDGDGDGYGAACELDDCDDDDAQINPGQPETCNNRIDDNCNGQIDENCETEVCEYQDQPCSDEGEFDNGFSCSALNENEPLRCYGLCDKSDPDPDSTCPEAGSICFGEDGICLTSCNTSDSVCSAGNGCLKIAGVPDEGICVPINPENNVGDPCDPNIFFDCEENSYCLDSTGNGRGLCVESCRPFEFEPGQSDCSGDNHCLPSFSDAGFCTEDNGQNAGDRCRDENRSCGEDAVGCYQGRCERFCRFGFSGDCLQNESCQEFDPASDLGLCS